MTHDELLDDDLASTEDRLRAALAAEARSLEIADLRERAVPSRTTRGSRRTMLVAAAAVVLVLGGVVTVLSLNGRGGSGLADPGGSATAIGPATSSASPTVVTVAGLPGSMASCAYGDIASYAHDAAANGGALVTGTLRLTGRTSTDEDGNLGWQSSQVEITIDSVLAGRVKSMTMTGWVASGVVSLDPPPPPSSGAANIPSDTAGATPILDYEGTLGWATDGAFLGTIYPNTSGGVSSTRPH
ncbi:MAG: hypothetical protein WKF57_14310 [Nakamurella sp.]